MSLSDSQRKEMDGLRSRAQAQVEDKISDEEQGVLSTLAGISAPGPSGLSEKGKQLPAEKQELTKSDLEPARQLDSKTVVEKTSEKAMEIVGDMHQAAVIGKAKDEEVQAEVKEHASSAIHSGLESIDDEIKNQRCKAFYSRHKTLLSYFGLDQPTEMWDMRVKVWIGSFWLGVSDIVFGVTVCPICLFTDWLSKKIKNVTWVAVIAVVTWLLIMLSPLIGWGISQLISMIQNAAG